MSALTWDHNAYYQRLLLRRVPPGSGRVLDVGCGAGSLAARLARDVGHVDAVDVSPVMIDAARRHTPANVNCRCADVLDLDLPPDHYDAIVSMTALHHLDLAAALRHLAPALRPGGVLAAIVLPRTELPRELPVELAAAVAHRLYGAVFAAARTLGGDGYRREPTHAVMPMVLDPPLTTRQARQVAVADLPGAQVRRLLFWRYLLTWRR